MFTLIKFEFKRCFDCSVNKIKENKRIKHENFPNFPSVQFSDLFDKRKIIRM